ncbi:glycosyltransferase family 9 protein [Streptomyces sp. NPDC058284]|uniref:glycosyltransferase family 9 protein n=1 Tax=unclassified Streptomyces TaxID=2593676 RepID=UPI00364C181B
MRVPGEPVRGGALAASVGKALVVCLDGMSGVLLSGPAVRAVAAGADHVTMLCGPRGAPAAELLPHVDEVVVWEAPWAGTRPPTVEEADVEGLVRRVREAAYDVALIVTPFAQSPLPTALLLRMAHVPRIGADTADHAGSLIDVPHLRLPGRHDAEAALDTAAALGFLPGTGDDGRLRVLPAPDTTGLTGNGPYVVLHPGAGAAARAWDAEHAAEAVTLLADAGHRVIVTGGPTESALTRRVGGDTAVDLGDRTDLRTLAGILRAADVVVAGDTGPAQLAAATGTPVVSVGSPSVPAERRSPYGVPAVLLGGQDDTGADTGRPGPTDALPEDVVRAVRKLLKEST